MKIVQPLLIFMLLATFVLYMNYFRTSLFDRLIALSIFGLGFLAVLFPGLTDAVAQSVGVGRGADLCVYIFSLATMFSLVLLYSKLARLERLNTQLARRMAIQATERKGSAVSLTEAR